MREAIIHFENFYEDTFLKLASYGELLELNVCDNLGDHLIGNVYAKFNTEEEAAKAYKGLLGQQYNGKDINVEYSPVTNFKECRCRQYEEGACERGAFCNFLHLKYVSKKFKKSLFEQMYTEHPEYKEKNKNLRNKNKNENYEENYYEKNKNYKNYNNNKFFGRHRKNSSKSSLGSCDSGERRNIINNWNKRYQKMKEDEKKKMKEEEAKKKIQMLDEQLKDNEKNLKNDEIFKNILNDEHNKDLSLTFNNEFD